MDQLTTTAVVTSIVVLLVLLIARVPIAVTLAISGALGITLIGGWPAAFAALGGSPFTATASYSLVVVPMFILLGSLAVQARIAENLFSLAQRYLGRIPGGLGLATVGASAGFAAISGSSVATAATFGKISIGEMRKHGYPGSFAAGLVATSGTLGAMIPPSILLVMYAVISGESVGMLLVAGILPGILQAIIYGIYTVYKGHRLQKSGLLAKVDRQSTQKSSSNKVSAASYRALIWIAAIFIVIIIGVYSGWFTISESAAIGAMIAALAVFIERRNEGWRAVMKRLYAGLRDSASLSAMIFFIIVGSSIFSYFLVLAGVPAAFTSWAIDLPIPPIAVVAVLLLLLIPFGMFLEAFSMLAVTVPLIYPVVTGLGFDGIWLGVLFVAMLELAAITPPVGVNVFVVSGAASGVPLEKVFGGILPFAILSLVSTGIIFLFPIIATALPNAGGLN